MSCRRVVMAVICVSAMLAASVRAEEDLNGLLCRLPGGANTVAVVNVKVVRERTGVKDSAIIAGTVFPPIVDTMVYVTHLEPGAMENRRVGGLVRLNREVTLKEIASLANGEVVNVGNMVIVDFGRRGYSFLMEPSLIGFARKTNLQDLYRWKQYGEANKKVELHEHLVDALAASKAAPIFGAVDLEHLISVKAVQERIAQTEGGAKMSKDRVESLAKLIASLTTVALSVDGAGLDDATIRLQFTEEVGESGAMIKMAFLEALADFGATIDDFEAAKVSVTGKTVTLTCKISPDSLVRIMSLFAPPPPPPPPTPAAPKLTASGVSIDATKSYYQTVDRMVSDLQRQTKKVKSYNKSAQWHETYADRIEGLNTRYVDADMVKYGQGLTAKLRSLAYSLKGAIVQVEAIQTGMAQTVYAAGTPSRWFSGGSVSMQANTNAVEMRTKQSEVVQQDAARRLEIWQKIDEERRDVLRQMRERYDIDMSRKSE